MQAPDCFLRGNKSPINLSILEVNSTNLLVPAAGKQQVVLRVHSGKRAGVSKFEDSATSFLIHIPLPHSAVLRTTEEVSAFKRQVIDFICVSKERFLQLAGDFLLVLAVDPKADQAVMESEEAPCLLRLAEAAGSYTRGVFRLSLLLLVQHRPQGMLCVQHMIFGVVFWHSNFILDILNLLGAGLDYLLLVSFGNFFCVEV